MDNCAELELTIGAATGVMGALPELPAAVALEGVLVVGGVLACVFVGVPACVLIVCFIGCVLRFRFLCVFLCGFLCFNGFPFAVLKYRFCVCFLVRFLVF